MAADPAHPIRVAALGGARAALCHRQPGDVLGHPARRCVLTDYRHEQSIAQGDNTMKTPIVRHHVRSPLCFAAWALCRCSASAAAMPARSTRKRPTRCIRQAALFALRGAQLPDPAVLRRHAPAHLVLLGRGRVRRAARPAGRLSLRQGRGGDGLHRPAGEALAAARFPRGGGPLGQHGLLPALPRRQARDAGRPDGRAAGTT